LRRIVLLVVAAVMLLAVPGTAIAQDVPLVDAFGNPILTDDSGNPVLLDESGNPVFLSTDESGNPILVDENGDPILIDESGNPIVEQGLANALCSPLNPNEVNALVPGCIFFHDESANTTP
jgi:hypothetical protein